MEISVEPMRAEDWPACRRIYEQGIATGLATFDTTAPDWEAWDAAHLPAARLVARLPGSGEVVGWVALSPVSERCVYAGVAEVSVYVAERSRGRGVGGRLLGSLIGASEAAGIWTVQAGIIRDNAASVALHERAGFRVVGVRERLGQLGGRWHDVLLLERRSDSVGRDAGSR